MIAQTNKSTVEFVSQNGQHYARKHYKYLQGFYNELCSYQIITQLRLEGYPIQILNYNPNKCFIEFTYIENLSDHHLSDQCNSEDADLALKALKTYARSLAYLHGKTLGEYDPNIIGFRNIISDYITEPWFSVSKISYDEKRLAKATASIEDTLRNLGVKCDLAYIHSMLVRAARYIDCGEIDSLTGLCQGDQNGLGGFSLVGDRGYFYDFDCGGVRNVFLEGLPWIFTWGGIIKLPYNISNLMTQDYLSSLKIQRSSLDEDSVNKSITFAAIRWNFFHIGDRLRVAIERNYQRGPTTLRAQVWGWISNFIEYSSVTLVPEELVEMNKQILLKLDNMWKTDEKYVPVYNAFAGQDI